MLDEVCKEFNCLPAVAREQPPEDILRILEVRFAKHIWAKMQREDEKLSDSELEYWSGLIGDSSRPAD